MNSESLENISAVQTSAGRGSRIKPLNMSSRSQTFPKGLIRIMGTPIAELQMEQFKRGGVNRLYVITQYLENRHFLSDRFGDGNRFGMEIEYSYPKDDEDNNGSADAIIRNIEKKGLTGHSLVLANDNLYEYDLKKVVDAHVKSGAVISIMTVRVHPTETIGNYGIVDTDEDKRVLKLVEKPKDFATLKEALEISDDTAINAANVKINTAGYLINNDVLATLAKNIPWIRDERAAQYAEDSNKFDMAGNLIPGLIAQGYPIFTIPIDNWGDFGSTGFFLDTFPRVLEGAFPSIYRTLEASNYYHDASRNAWIHPKSAFKQNDAGKTLVERINQGAVKVGPNVFIGRNCIIEDGAEIRFSDVEKYAHIEEGTILDHAYISPFCSIGQGATLRSCAIGLNTRIKSSSANPTYINGRSIIGPEVTVPLGTKVYETKVFPGFEFPNTPGATYKKQTLK